MIDELTIVCQKLRPIIDSSLEKTADLDIVSAVRQRIESLALEASLRKEEAEIREDFRDLFEPIPHVNRLPTDCLAEIHLKDPTLRVKGRSYPCPRKYREAWQILIKQHLDAGRIRPSSSPHASPAFIVPKSDPTALPRWVNDYRQLNANTVVDSHPIPCADDILNDCAKGNFFRTIDMMNSFFQTKMHPDHIHLTAVSPPFSFYEWLVMPMGLRNAPSIHQRRVTHALRDLLGRICHIYLDDIIVWSKDMKTQIIYTHEVFSALQKANLYINPNKTKLLCTEVDFLGHHISANGIEPDNKKVDKILSWPRPKSTTQTRSFLGLVRYVSSFLPKLADHSAALADLMTKSADKSFPSWTPEHERAFVGIKETLVGRECLTTIDFAKMPEYKIYVTTDASDTCSGAVLSFGPSWKTARPVTFDSSTFKDTELNYPVHEKELLAMIRALKKWRSDLIGSPFYVFTDHKTLENFDTQKDLSRRQARWMEFLSQYDTQFVYVRGDRNSVADALSRHPADFCSADAEKNASRSYPASLADEDMLCYIFDPGHRNLLCAVAALSDIASDIQTPSFTLSISADKDFLHMLRSGYDTDPWTKSLVSAAHGIK